MEGSHRCDFSQDAQEEKKEEKVLKGLTIRHRGALSFAVAGASAATVTGALVALGAVASESSGLAVVEETDPLEIVAAVGSVRRVEPGRSKWRHEGPNANFLTPILKQIDGWKYITLRRILQLRNRVQN